MSIRVWGHRRRGLDRHTRALRALATCATTTEMSLHGPHHVAQKSTSTGTVDCGGGEGAAQRRRVGRESANGGRCRARDPAAQWAATQPGVRVAAVAARRARRAAARAPRRGSRWRSARRVGCAPTQRACGAAAAAHRPPTRAAAAASTRASHLQDLRLEGGLVHDDDALSGSGTRGANAQAAARGGPAGGAQRGRCAQRRAARSAARAQRRGGARRAATRGTAGRLLRRGRVAACARGGRGRAAGDPRAQRLLHGTRGGGRSGARGDVS
jgi:hypothetical protein